MAGGDFWRPSPIFAVLHELYLALLKERCLQDANRSPAKPWPASSGCTCTACIGYLARQAKLKGAKGAKEVEGCQAFYVGHLDLLSGSLNLNALIAQGLCPFSEVGTLDREA